MTNSEQSEGGQGARLANRKQPKIGIIFQPGREMKNSESNKDEAKMTTMQRREIRKPIDEEIDILT